ncbi:hypothetical protein KQ909_15370 [Bacteroides stercoris]|uniref:hypothetical protein n=1 Tax=Bacteroides stercoris TaxID=46506 RepID=UPI001C2CD081|nr:hypothetical protein [Bacteroides stercoris]MBV1681372.1 hypothetical protein [Bacteroides stercoris]
MKRILFMLFAVIMSTAVCHAAMSNSKVRKETRFLTDKMAYELNLNTAQYNDVYEINYDFISGVRYLMDDVLRGEEWALNRYYDYLDIRNDDLRWVLSRRQYSRFMQAAYFFRPIYVSGGHWSFRIYVTYTNPNHFYYPRPYHYRTYCGGHNRVHYHNVSYYRGRHNYPTYNGSFRIRDNKSYHTSRRSDFGSVHIRPNSGTRPNVEQSNRRPATNSPVRRSDTKKEVNAPKRGQSIQKENESVRRRSNSSSSSTHTTRSSSRSSERGKEASRRN